MGIRICSKLLLGHSLAVLVNFPEVDKISLFLLDHKQQHLLTVKEYN